MVPASESHWPAVVSRLACRPGPAVGSGPACVSGPDAGCRRPYRSHSPARPRPRRPRCGRALDQPGAGTQPVVPLVFHRAPGCRGGGSPGHGLAAGCGFRGAPGGAGQPLRNAGVCGARAVPPGGARRRGSRAGCAAAGEGGRQPRHWLRSWPGPRCVSVACGRRPVPRCAPAPQRATWPALDRPTLRNLPLDAQPAPRRAKYLSRPEFR